MRGGRAPAAVDIDHDPARQFAVGEFVDDLRGRATPDFRGVQRVRALANRSPRPHNVCCCPKNGLALFIGRAAWSAFLQDLKTGSYDL